MLSLVLFPYDPIAIWGLAVAIIGVVVGIVAAIAAIAAAHYAKKAPTANDLARVEEHVSHLPEVKSGIASLDARMKRQEDTDELRIRASRVSIAASGNISGNVPFPLRLSVREPKHPNISLTHVELYNEHENLFGSFPCSPSGDRDWLAFDVEIPMATMGDWHRGGTPVQMVNRMRLKLRVWMLMDGLNVYRDMAVIVIETTSGGGLAGYILEGRV